MQFVVIMTAISSFKVFDPIQVMTSGGPMRATTNLVFYVYEHAFEYLKMNQPRLHRWCCLELSC